MAPPKPRIYDVYKDLGLESSKDLIAILESQFGQSIKSHSSTIDPKLIAQVKTYLKSQKTGAKESPKTTKSAAKATPEKAGKPAAKSTKSEPVSAPEPAKPAAAAEPDDDDNDGRPRIDPSKVRVIKRQPPPETPVVEPAATATPESASPIGPVGSVTPTVIERKTPIVESKRYLIDGTPPPPPPPVTANRKPGDIVRPAASSSAASHGQARPGTVLDKPGGGQSPEEKTEAGVPANPASNEPTRTYIAGQAPSAPGAPEKTEHGRRLHFAERSWPQERPIAPPSQFVKKAPRKTKRQIQAEKMDAIRKQQEEEALLLAAPKIISLAEPITVSELAKKLRIKDTELIKHLFMKGAMVTVNQRMEVDFARTIAKEFEFVIEEEELELEKATQPDTQYEALSDGGEQKNKIDYSQFKNLQHRSPVVSIMGHVDHGKTTLLDTIRETHHKIVDTEAGGITQSIGAYTVEKNDHKIVFLDTPGHEAFTAMRMRGARSTDIAILVVAADDGVMPQTIEAINHAKAAQIPIIVAVNKIDKEDADPDRVLGQLAEYGLASEKWGGETLTCEVSALQKVGLEEVLDNILLVAELLDLKADSTVAAQGVIIEAQLDKRMGPVATALVQNGTLRVGDNVLIGAVGGRVRALIDDMGNRVQEAGPATPVEILGLESVPNAGESFQVIDNDKQFKQALNIQKLKEREQRLNVTRKTVSPGFAAINEGSGATGELQFNVIIKADTQGTVEAVADLVRQLTTAEIKVNVLHNGTGDINEADVMLASTTNALIIGFNVKEDTNADGLAKQQGILVKMYDVIYHIAEDVEKMMLGKLSPDFEENETGRAEVRQLFKVGKSAIAGCMVTSGKILRNAKATVFRDGQEIFTGIIDNLKRFKDDAKEVASGYECGISFDKFNDLQPGDQIAVFTVKELERTSL